MYAELILKKCSTCKLEKERTEFWKRSLSRDGLAYICKTCDGTRYMRMKKEKGSALAAKQKEWRDNNKDRIRKNRLQHKFRMSVEDFERLRRQQNYSCAICGEHESKAGRYKILNVDHDHKTGKSRGLLCSNCNRCLGLLKDSISYLDKAIKYLKKYQK